MQEFIISELSNYLEKIKSRAEDLKEEIKTEVLSHQDGMSHNYETEEEDYRETREWMAEKHNVDINDVYIHVDGDYITINAKTKREKTVLEKEQEIVYRFNQTALDFIIRKMMKTNEYGRKPYNQDNFKDFNPYNLLTNKEYDKLISYYKTVLYKENENESNL